MFEEVLGHKRAKDIIEGFMKNGLPQRMIFSGPKSVGKSKIAIELAKSILKDAYKTDMLLIEKETIKIDDIRDAISFLSKRAFFGVKFLILDVNTITPEAQNAFLKALEEPYHNNYIIIIIDVPEKLFSTIRSRCVNIRFGYLSESIVAEKKLKYRSFIFEPLEALESKKM
ncbi:MAG: hypothetical protein NZ870_03170, partial [bacterium]|nr:hypothetical protein [bacterium]